MARGMPRAVEELDPRLVELIRRRGWSGLTMIQEKAIPVILEGANAILVAPTGEGKTEAALLPILSMMAREGAEPVSLLYITPMKALINDLYLRISWWASKLGFRVARKHGDTSASERSRRLRNVPHILVTTPESLEIDLDWSRRFRVYYRNLRWVIVDEVHELLSNKRGAQFIIQLERLARIAGRDIQRIGLSATIGDLDRALELLSGSSSRRRVIVDGRRVKKPRLSVAYVKDDSSDPWLDVAARVLREVEKPSLVFVNSRYVAEKLKDSLERLNAREIFVHHSSVSAELREEAEERLRSGSLSAIVCTKTLEVGIDVGKIKKVIQVRAPGRVASLLQRVGRSGHTLDGESRGSIVAMGVIDFAESLAEAELAYDGYVENVIIERIPLDVIAKEVLGMAMERGGVPEAEAFNLIKSVNAYTLTREEFDRMLSYMEGNGLIKRVMGVIRPGPTFYKIWQFRGDRGARMWWSRDFSEFFSTIPEKDSFIVRHGDKTIGYIDAIFVYKHLRVGDTIRLAGRSWSVKRIDENMAKIEVEPAESTAEIPLWKGEGPRRSSRVAEVFMDVIMEPSSIHGVEADRSGLEAVEQLRDRYYKLGIEPPSRDTIIYEEYNGEHIVTAPLGSGVSETLAIVLSFLASKEAGLNVYYRSTFFGFSIGARDFNPIEALKSIDLAEFEDLVAKAVRRSPYTFQVLREIQLDLGKIGSIDMDEDGILVDEAVRQVIEEHLNVREAMDFIERLKEGRIKVLTTSIGGLTPLALEVLRFPPIRPWMQDLAMRIARMLEGTALTVIELADLLELAEKTIDSRLREMRKPDYKDHRVAGFIDIDEDDWRWVLVKDLEEVASMEEFSHNFEPARMRDPLRIVIRTGPGSKPRELIVDPESVLSNWDEIAKRLPDEIYMMRISSAYSEGSRDDVSVTHYYVPSSIAKYLILNAATYIQKKEWEMAV